MDSTLDNYSSKREAENVELNTVVKSSFPLSDLEKLPPKSDLEKLPMGLIYQITAYLNLTDILQFTQVSKSLSKSTFTLRQLEELYRNRIIFKKPKLIQRYLNLIPFSYDTYYGVFYESIKSNHFLIVEMLLADSRVDPSLHSNIAIRLASQLGHVEIVEMLIADPRVDPVAGKNCPICNACENGHNNVVEILLADSRVDPSVNDNQAIRFAAQNGHQKIVEMLLADSRVDPSANGNYAIQHAAFKGNLE
ncbi:hypothetical protein HDV02_005637, partial [Globomyces sp. JEL0801]